MDSIRTFLRSHGWFLFGLALTVALFWGLRIHYWVSTEEAPFSDMQDYQLMAENIRDDFDFSWKPPFYKAYVTPIMPGLRALQMALTGPEKIDWSAVQTLLLFAGLIFLAWEIYQWTRNRWLALGLLAVVALSQSSIFWSLKIARESLAEASIYWLAATLLWAFRKQQAWRFFIVGTVAAIALLNRNNFLLVLPSMGLLILFQGIDTDFKFFLRRRLPTNLLPFGLFCFGVILAWSPWIIRNYKLSGEFIPLGTQTPYSFFWEYGQVEVTLPNRATKTFDTNQLAQEANRDFQNDFAAYREHKKLIPLWMLQNGPFWVKRVITRNIPRGINDNTIYLTKVPRENIFQSSWDIILLDKNPIFLITGMTGLILFVWGRGTPGFTIAVVTILPWLNAALVISYPRMIEPSVPLMLYGNMLLVAKLVEVSKSIKSISLIPYLKDLKNV